MEKKQYRAAWILCVFYCALMLRLLLFRAPSASALPYVYQLRQHFNPIPFRTIRLYARFFRPPLRIWLVRQAVVNLFGNVIMFVPLGLFPPLLGHKLQRFYRTFLLALGIMIIIETAQMLLLVGTCDIDDLILNMLGASIGYSLFGITHRESC